MTALADIVAIGDALAAQLASGTFDGRPINAGWLPTNGQVDMPAAMLIPPAPKFDPLGEGSHVAASTWTVQLYTDGGGLGPDAQQEIAFLLAVLAALESDPSLAGAVLCATPLEAPEPAVQNTGTEASPRRAYVRSLRLTIDH